GVDVFNKNWGIEGSYINYGQIEPNSNTIKLREYSVRGLYNPSISTHWNARMGLGVSSRFLNISNPQVSQEYRTPSGLFLFGVESYINSFISFGADLSFKTAMIDDTIDKNSVDLAFKVDAHF
ncbi:MAG: hypothetical protein MJK18_11490, partial [Bdellovibrionales bacterium]|nr:hypothetical protein [Bdellovibrionales bacterium]